jgi:hypothetical protein
LLRRQPELTILTSGPSDDGALVSSAELSSLSSTLDQVLQRVTALADGRTHKGEPDELAVALYEVERSLQEARRRLGRALAISRS